MVGAAAAVGTCSLIIGDTCQRRLPISVQMSEWENQHGGLRGTGLAPAGTAGLTAGLQERHRQHWGSSAVPGLVALAESGFLRKMRCLGIDRRELGDGDGGMG